MRVFNREMTYSEFRVERLICVGIGTQWSHSDYLMRNPSEIIRTNTRVILTELSWGRGSGGKEASDGRDVAERKYQALSFFSKGIKINEW